MHARELLTIRHSFFLKVNERTRVYYVGQAVKAVEHDTSLSDFDGIELKERPHAARIEMEKPVNVAKPAGYCSACNVMWIAAEPHEARLTVPGVA